MTALRTPLQMVLDGVDLYPDRDVLTFVEVLADGEFSDTIRTYQDLLANGQAIAGALASEGMGDGKAFAIIMRNHPEFVDLMIGSEIASTTFVPIDPRTRGEKLAYMLRFSECRGAVVADNVLPELLLILPSLPKLKWIWTLDTAIQDIEHAPSVRVNAFDTILADTESSTNITPAALDQPMQLLFTSGTTGDPKAIVAPYSRYAAVSSLGMAIGLQPDDRPYTGLSLTHANAQIITLGCSLASGLRLVISLQFTKSRLWEILTKYECTMFSLLGGMAIAIYAEPPSSFERSHQIRYVLSAGMPKALWNNFSERFNVEVFEFFGTAEGGLTLNPPNFGPVGSIGKAAGGTICAILDESDQECPPDIIGELCFRPIEGEAEPVAYFKNPKASKEKVSNGWFRTGDAGYKDADGWIYFTHRISNSIRRNGDFINAGHIEAEIASLDIVDDVHVYGYATAMSAPGEKEVIAAIVPQPGVNFDPSIIFKYCQNHIGTNSTPSFVQVVDEIPKTASEKPQERFLVEMMEAENMIGSLFDKNGPATLLAKGGQ